MNRVFLAIRNEDKHANRVIPPIKLDDAAEITGWDKSTAQSISYLLNSSDGGTLKDEFVSDFEQESGFFQLYAELFAETVKSEHPAIWDAMKKELDGMNVQHHAVDPKSGRRYEANPEAFWDRLQQRIRTRSDGCKKLGSRQATPEDYTEHSRDIYTSMLVGNSEKVGSCMMYREVGEGRYVSLCYKGVTYWAHRVAATLTFGYHPSVKVDETRQDRAGRDGRTMNVDEYGRWWHASHLCGNCWCCNKEHLDFEQSRVNVTLRCVCQSRPELPCGCGRFAPNGRECIKGDAKMKGDMLESLIDGFRDMKSI